jgi:FkbM family methyltransferase
MKQVKGWWLPDTDTDFDRWILDGEYQKKQRDAILEFVNKDGNAIDIGAHVGFWLRDMCKQFKHVYAFEPIEEVRQCLAKNVSAENYSTYSVGLGAKNENLKVNYNPAETGNTHASKDGNQTITIRKLDDMNLPKIDYIKVDTEGFEIEVLKGGEKLIKEYKPFVHVEVKGKVLVKQGLSSDDVDEYLKSIDYKEVFRISSERVYVHK